VKRGGGFGGGLGGFPRAFCSIFDSFWRPLFLFPLGPIIVLLRPIIRLSFFFFCDVRRSETYRPRTSLSLLSLPWFFRSDECCGSFISLLGRGGEAIFLIIFVAALTSVSRRCVPGGWVFFRFFSDFLFFFFFFSHCWASPETSSSNTVPSEPVSGCGD